MAVLVNKQAEIWPGMVAWFGREMMNRGLDQAHFWFLETLFCICLLAIPLARFLNRLETGWFRKVLVSPAAPVVFAIPSFLILLTMDWGTFATPKGLMPVIPVVAVYFIYFAVGWGVFVNRDLLPRLKRSPVTYILPVAALGVVNVYSVLTLAYHKGETNWLLQTAAASSTALLSWLMFFACMGLFLRHASGEKPWLRYLSDSAYWIYLAHPLALVAIQIPLMFVRMPSELKVVLNLLFAVPVLLWSYDRLVRNSWIGAILNGRRYPRGLPVSEPEVCEKAA